MMLKVDIYFYKRKSPIYKTEYHPRTSFRRFSAESATDYYKAAL